MGPRLALVICCVFININCLWGGEEAIIQSDGGQVKADCKTKKPDAGIKADGEVEYPDAQVKSDQGKKNDVFVPPSKPDTMPPAPPVCGDGKCQPGEAGPAGSCNTDCLPCPEPPMGYVWTAKPVGCANQFLAWYYNCSGKVYTTQSGGGTGPAGATGVSVDPTCQVRICMTPPGGVSKCVTCGDHGGWLGCP